MLYALIIVLISVLFGILLHFMALKRGRNPVFWGVLGVCLGPLAVPFLVFSRRLHYPGNSGTAEHNRNA